MEKKRLSDWLKRPAVRVAVIAVGCVGMAMIGLSEWMPSSGKEDVISAEVYQKNLTRELEYLLRGINGVGDCRVMVTLENGEENLYAENENYTQSSAEENGASFKKSENQSRENTVVLSEGTGLLVTQICPTVRGVAVICDGGGREEVRAAVTEAVTTVLNISARRVCVMEAS